MQLNRATSLAVLSLFLGGCCCGSAPRAVKPAARAKTPTAKIPVERRIQTAGERRIRAVLAKKRLKGLHWDEASLDQVVMYLRTVTGVNFYITPKVREETFDDVAISAQLDDVSVETILSVVVTEPFELRWDVRDGVVWIHSPEEFAGPTRLRYFDVKDLIGKDLTGKDVDGGFPTMDDLTIDLQRNVLPEYWEQEGVSIEGRNGILIVRAAEGALTMIGRELDGIRGKAAPTAKAPKGNDPGKPVRALAPSAANTTKVSLSVSDQPLEDVVKTLQIQTGLNLMIDPRIAADVRTSRVTALKLVDAPLSAAMKMLAAAAGADCLWVRKGSVHVLTRKEFLKP